MVIRPFLYFVCPELSIGKKKPLTLQLGEARSGALQEVPLLGRRKSVAIRIRAVRVYMERLSALVKIVGLQVGRIGRWGRVGIFVVSATEANWSCQPWGRNGRAGEGSDSLSESVGGPRIWAEP